MQIRTEKPKFELFVFFKINDDQNCILMTRQCSKYFNAMKFELKQHYRKLFKSSCKFSELMPNFLCALQKLLPSAS